MQKGTGVRISRLGMKFLSLEKDKGNLKITAIGGDSDVSVERFAEIIPDTESPIALGLCPGDFAFSFFPREDNMTDDEMLDHLRWEIEKKVLSGAAEYNFDFAIIGNTGFAFAGRKKLISVLSSHGRKILTDVEPAALLNGMEGSDEIENGVMVLVSVEAEGISSVILQNGIPAGIDSIPFSENMHQQAGTFDFESVDDSFVEKIAGQVLESIGRITIFGEYKKNISPDLIVLAGEGSYAGNIRKNLENLTDVKVKISSPFKNISAGMDLVKSSFPGKDASFTTCFGLALRAMEV